jgi:hypothetical protein
MSSPTFPSSQLYTPPTNPSPNLQALLAYVEARNEWSTDHTKVMGFFDDSLEHRILPKSLGRPVLTKKQYSDYVAGLLRFIASYKVRTFALPFQLP